MSFILSLPPGTIASPSLQFSGSTNTGVTSPTSNVLSMVNNGVESVNISSAGVVTIIGFTSVGIVHNSAAGILSSSLIVNADITNLTITDS